MKFLTAQLDVVNDLLEGVTWNLNSWNERTANLSGSLLVAQL